MTDRESISRRLRDIVRRGGGVCVDEQSSIADLEAESWSDGVDAIVVGIDGSSSECLEAFSSARSRFADVALVGLWPDSLRAEHRRVLKSGAGGLVRESDLEEALIPTLRAVRSGLICYPRSPAASGAATLSSREKQVLGMLIIGFTNGEIARRLYLAESTIKTHVSSAYMKLGVRSRKDAAALILDPYVGLGTGILTISS